MKKLKIRCAQCGKVEIMDYDGSYGVLPSEMRGLCSRHAEEYMAFVKENEDLSDVLPARTTRRE